MRLATSLDTRRTENFRMPAALIGVSQERTDEAPPKR